jgi:hypothetical protein
MLSIRKPMPRGLAFFLILAAVAAAAVMLLSQQAREVPVRTIEVPAEPGQ